MGKFHENIAWQSGVKDHESLGERMLNICALMTAKRKKKTGCRTYRPRPTIRSHLRDARTLGERLASEKDVGI